MFYFDKLFIINVVVFDDDLRTASILTKDATQGLMYLKAIKVGSIGNDNR